MSSIAQYCPTCGKHNSSPKIPLPQKRQNEIGRVMYLEPLNMIGSEIMWSGEMYLIGFDVRDLSNVHQGSTFRSLVLKVGK